MDVLNIRAEYLRAVHFFYFFVSIISLAFAVMSTGDFRVSFLLFFMSFGNVGISWISKASIDRFFRDDEGHDNVNYVVLFMIALLSIFMPLYTGLVLFESMKPVVVVVSCFLFFWGFLNYMFTRVSVIRDIFRIVHLTKYTFGMSKVFSIFTDPGYEGLVDVLNLIEPRLVKYYEPGASKGVDEILSRIADENDVQKLRKLVVMFGVELYGFEIGELVREQNEKDVDNTALVRRFGYKRKLLELVEA